MAIDLSFFRSPTSMRLRAEGRWEGRTEWRRQHILLVLEKRGINVSGEARRQIETCLDLRKLKIWLTRASTAASAEELFTES